MDIIRYIAAGILGIVLFCGVFFILFKRIIFNGKSRLYAVFMAAVFAAPALMTALFMAYDTGILYDTDEDWCMEDSYLSILFIRLFTQVMWLFPACFIYLVHRRKKH